MKIITWTDIIQNTISLQENVSFTTGVFDGVHKGHRKLISTLVSKAGNLSIVSTFSSNPFKTFFPDRYLGDILTLRQKTELIETLGVDFLLLIDFSTNFSKLSGRDFFRILGEHLPLKHVVLGKNHRCGHRGDTGAMEAQAFLEPLGIVVDIVDPKMIDGHPVSSTRIREAVTAGDMEKAENLIGRFYSLDVRDIEQEISDRTVRFRRRNVIQIVPKNGRYACYAKNERTAVKAVLEIDDRDLLLTMEKQLEVTGIDFLHKTDQ